MVFLKVDLELLTKGTLSKDAILLYSYLTGLRKLSEQNNIKDKEGRIVVFCTTDKVMEKLNISKPTALKIFKELEAVNYIRRVRRGQGKASYIYVIPYKQETEVVSKFTKPEREQAEIKESSNENSCNYEKVTVTKTEVLADKEKEGNEIAVEAENRVKVEKIKCVMKEIIRQENINIPQTVENMILFKIQYNKYKIYNLYRYVMKCIENYLANSFNITKSAQNCIFAARPMKLYNHFNNFEQRDNSDEEMNNITKRCGMKSYVPVNTPKALINRFNNFEQRYYSDEEMEVITKKLLMKA